MAHKLETALRAICGLSMLVFASVAVGANSGYAQNSSSQQVQVSPPPLQRFEAPSPDASPEQLEIRADAYRAAKDYLAAFDYYRAALAKKPNSAILFNKIGIDELFSDRYREAEKCFERATRLDPHYAEAFNNLGVLEYLRRRYGRAVKQYEKAIKLDPGDASYYGNIGSAYFSKKDWEKATQAYGHAVSLDPDVFGRTSNAGVAGQIASPSDRAHFSYVLAKLYAKDGLTDRSLECLRRAMEEGYKIDDVYKDPEFSAVRKDPRFAQLMGNRPVPIPE